MRFFLLLLCVVGMSFFVFSHKASAASEADCAIWICLPGGFPSGCAAAYGAFRDRIKHGKPPLPELWSCTSGPNGERVSGLYQFGREVFEPCAEGYVLREEAHITRGKCYIERCAPARYVSGNMRYCKSYDAVKRVKENYIKLWVGGEYLGQFWY